MGSLIFIAACKLLVIWNLVPWPEIKPSPLHWELGDLATGPPEKSQTRLFWAAILQVWFWTSNRSITWGLGGNADSLAPSRCCCTRNPEGGPQLRSNTYLKDEGDSWKWGPAFLMLKYCCCCQVWLFATLQTAVQQASLSLSQSLPKFMPLASGMPSNHLVLKCENITSLKNQLKTLSSVSCVFLTPALPPNSQWLSLDPFLLQKRLPSIPLYFSCRIRSMCPPQPLPNVLAPFPLVPANNLIGHGIWGHKWQQGYYSKSLRENLKGLRNVTKMRDNHGGGEKRHLGRVLKQQARPALSKEGAAVTVF